MPLSPRFLAHWCIAFQMRYTANQALLDSCGMSVYRWIQWRSFNTNILLHYALLLQYQRRSKRSGGRGRTGFAGRARCYQAEYPGDRSEERHGVVIQPYAPGMQEYRCRHRYSKHPLWKNYWALTHGWTGFWKRFSVCRHSSLLITRGA